MKATLMLPAAALLGLSMLLCEAARAQVVNLCDAATPETSPTTHRWVFLTTEVNPTFLLGHVELFVGDTGEANAVGMLRVCDGRNGCSHQSRGRPAGSVLVAENGAATVVCADADGDGVAGLVTLQMDARDVSSGDLVEVTVLPNGGDVDDAVALPVTIIIEGTTYTGWSSFYRSF